ncbi:MAG: FG-GAP repeat domain-containing protein, partial [Acidobacteriota bacterium]
MSKDVHSHLFTPRGSGRPLRLARARLLGVGLVALGLLVVAAPRAGPIAAGGTERSRALPDAPRASRPDAGLSAALRKLEPGEDGWNSEAFQEVAEARLRRMGELAGRRQRVDAAAVRGIVGPGFACDPLRPALLRTVYSSESIEAHVLDASERRRRAPPAQHRGAEGLARALMELISPFDASSRIAVDVKMFRVDLRGTTVDTSVLVHAYGPAKQGSLEQHSTWRVQWVWGSPDVDPVLVHIGVESFEEITSRQGSLFHDGTQTILGADQGFREQVARSTDYWLERLERWIERDFEGYCGLALGDVNGDGLDDLYLPQMTGLPNRLYVRRPDGTLRDRSAASGVDWLDRTRSALILDLDNDGDEDLVVGARSAVLFMDNDGQGRFAVRSAVA